MESTASEPPFKKARSINGQHITECRREFKLTQQFPSMARPTKQHVAWKTKNETTVPANPLTKSAVTVHGKHAQAAEKVKKLRIKLPDGRDLGELNVQLLSQGDEFLNNKTLTFTKSNLLNNLNKPVVLSVLPMQKTSKLLPSAPLMQEKTSKGAVVTLKSLPPNVLLRAFNVSKDGTKLVRKPLILNRKKCQLQPYVCETELVSSSVQGDSLEPKKVAVASEKGGVEPGKKHEKLQQTQKLLKTSLKSNENGSQSKVCDLRKSEPSRTDRETETQCKVVSSNVDDESMKSTHWQLAQSKFPLVKCEKLPLSDCSIKVSGDCLKTEGHAAEHETSSVTEDKTRRSSCENSLSENDEGRTKEISEVRENKGETSRKTTEKPTASDKGDSDSSRCVARNLNNDLSSLSSQKTGNPTDGSLTLTSCNVSDSRNDPAKDRMSQQWNVIKEAVSSVKDEQLRAKALQALADCGISLERHVPIRPPETLKVLHDIQIQTEVFGLLDSESFVLVRTDSPNLERIKQTERAFASPLINASPWPATKSKNNILHDNINLLPRESNVPVPVDDPEFDCFFKKLCSENPMASKVQEVLSKPNPICKKICTQLQKDFESLRMWDESGMLNIHRAVVNDNLQDVQRLLMVVKSSKESVDITTEDGMTSLELAVKCNSSLAITKLLLEAGAQPVPSKLAHDSALTLACKMSSPLLLELVNHVKSPKLLDQVDSIGFAPLHYCALYGNLEGVKALLDGGADVNLKDSRSGRTAFFHALENNHLNVTQTLLRHGAVANITNFAGQSVLSIMGDVRNLTLKTTSHKTT